jgi:hypothetical protein
MRLFRPNLSFLSEAQPRLKTGEDKNTFWQRWTLHFLDDRTNYEAKEIEKNHKFILYLPFSNILLISTY